MSDDLTRAAKIRKAGARDTAPSMQAFKQPRAPDEGERLARKVKAEKSELKRRKKAKRAFKKR